MFVSSCIVCFFSFQYLPIGNWYCSNCPHFSMWLCLSMCNWTFILKLCPFLHVSICDFVSVCLCANMQLCNCVIVIVQCTWQLCTMYNDLQNSPPPLSWCRSGPAHTLSSPRDGEPECCKGSCQRWFWSASKAAKLRLSNQHHFDN